MHHVQNMLQGHLAKSVYTVFWVLTPLAVVISIFFPALMRELSATCLGVRASALRGTMRYISRVKSVIFKRARASSFRKHGVEHSCDA